MARADLPDNVLAGLLEPPDADETILTRWSHCALTDSPATTLGRGLSGDSMPPEVNARIVAHREDAVSADYVVVGTLGVGGMGIVFDAEQVYFGRRVALKMIKPTLASDPAAAKAFFREAVITSRLDHPGIIPILDFGMSQDGRALYAMMKAGGVPWHRVMRDKTFSDNLAIFDRVADVVAHAHRQGVIHRDIKPANVLLGNHGEVWLADWGVALARLPDGTYSAAGPAGTPQYMAPEMALCGAERIGPASDIYLLGAVMFEIITGSPPHSGENAGAALLNSAQNLILPADQTNGLLPIAYKAMAALPEHRYATVDELREAVKKRLRLNESVYHQQQADTHLSAARKTGDYELFQQAIAAYDEVIALSAENATSRHNRSRALAEYADKALEKGEFDLAASIVQPETASDKRAARMLAKIAAGKTAARRRHRRRTWANTILGSIVFLVLMGGTYVYYDRIGNPKSRFNLPDPAYERRLNMDGIRSNSLHIQRQFLMMDSWVSTMMRNVPDPNRPEKRQVLRKMENLFDGWKKLYDVPNRNSDDTVIRFTNRIHEDVPQLDALIREYRALAPDSMQERLKEDAAKLKEYLDDSVRRLAELEKANAP